MALQRTDIYLAVITIVIIIGCGTFHYSILYIFTVYFFMFENIIFVLVLNVFVSVSHVSFQIYMLRTS